MHAIATRQTRTARPTAAAPAGSLRTVRRVGYAIIALQFTGFIIWSNVLYSHFSLTPDFAQYSQAWYEIAHGNLNPYDTMGRFLFWQNHSEFVMWPLSLLYYLWPHSDLLVWLQDACIAAAEVVAFTWLCEIALTQRLAKIIDARWLAAAGLTLLAIDPWTWWAISFDFHSESLAVLFTVLLGRDLWNGRRRAWLW